MLFHFRFDLPFEIETLWAYFILNAVCLMSLTQNTINYIKHRNKITRISSFQFFSLIHYLGDKLSRTYVLITYANAECFETAFSELFCCLQFSDPTSLLLWQSVTAKFWDSSFQLLCTKTSETQTIFLKGVWQR
jgi:hypothetical protein